MRLLLVTVPALLGAAGTVVSAYVAVKVRQVHEQTNSQLDNLNAELLTVRRELYATKNRNLLE